VSNKSGNKVCESRSARMRIAVWIVFVVGGWVAGYYLDRMLWHRLFVFTPYHLVSAVTGFVLFQVMRKIARNTGRFLHDHGRAGDIPRFETNVLVTGGYYRYMRHPMHQGLMLAPVAIALLAGSPSFLLIIAPLEIFLMYVMIATIEEQEAIKKFGDDYRRFMQRVPRFCCRCECWKMLIFGLPEENNTRGEVEV